MLKKIIISLLFGFFVTIFIAQHDEWVKKEVATIVCQEMNKAFNTCSFTCNSSFTTLNFFSPEIVLDGLRASPVENNEGWGWHCKKFKISFSWLHLLQYREFDLHITLDEYEVHSSFEDNKLAIVPHLQEFFGAPLLSVHTILKSVSVHNGVCTIIDSKNDLRGTIVFGSESKQFGMQLKTVLRLTDGSLTVSGRTLYAGLNGSIKVELDCIDHNPLLSIDCSCTIPQLENSFCLISGSWKDNIGHFTIKDIEEQILVDPIIITYKKNDIWIDVATQFPLSYAWRLIANDAADKQLIGSCSLAMRGNLNEDYLFEGTGTVRDVVCNGVPICSTGQLNFKRENKVFTGSLQVVRDENEMCGDWHYDLTEHAGALTMQNPYALSISDLSCWYIRPHELVINFFIDKFGVITNSYTSKIAHTNHETIISGDGSGTIENNNFSMRGLLGKQRYECSGSAVKRPYLQKFIYFDENGVPLITLIGQQMGTNMVTGSVQYSVLRYALKTLYNYDAQGEGELRLSGTYDKGIFGLNIHLEQGTVRLPQTYNFINSFDSSFEYDVGKGMIRIPKVHCTLHAGTMSLDGGVIMFDTSNYKLLFVHIPVLFDRCLLNIQKDLFAVTSGYIVYDKKKAEDQPLLHGQFILDRAQLKQNLFSLDVQKNLLKNAGTLFIFPDLDVDLALTVETKQPIRIDTSLLEADAVMHFLIKNKVSDPVLAGSINVLSGKLKFPYKSLQITKGTVTFLPGQLYNPVVEFVAKNRIKKYLVSLHANGFLKDHQVTLESSPSLTEEQIVSLLLVGSEKDSLNVMMPALIAQNFKMALFGANQSSLFDKYFKRPNVPFNINLIPSFTDQTGRGGLRGGIEINVKDRWRALIQKNFSLSEDTRFELEYLLSDDISARVVRDERRDIGAEIEMKWKF